MACQTLHGAEINIIPVILSGLLYTRLLSNCKRPSESTFWGGTLGLFRVPGINENSFLDKEVVPNFCASYRDLFVGCQDQDG
jgi:hypothetical protein